MSFLDVLLLAVLAGIVVLAVRRTWKSAKNGCSACGGGCPGCCGDPQGAKKKEQAPEDLP